MLKTPMTVQGAKQLQDELARLLKEDRPRIINAIAQAREHGDLKENAEYQAAKEEQGFIEARIRDLEAKLSNAQIIDVTQLSKQDKVVFGATVTLVDVDTDEQSTYQIVGVDEADIKAGKLSLQSPLARAIIGKSIDDEVHIEIGDKVQAYEIKAIEYI